MPRKMSRGGLDRFVVSRGPAAAPLIVSRDFCSCNKRSNWCSCRTCWRLKSRIKNSRLDMESVTIFVYIWLYIWRWQRVMRASHGIDIPASVRRVGDMGNYTDRRRSTSGPVFWTRSNRYDPEMTRPHYLPPEIRYTTRSRRVNAFRGGRTIVGLRRLSTRPAGIRCQQE